MPELRGGGNRKWDGILEKDALKAKWGMKAGNTEALSGGYAQRPRTVAGAAGSGGGRSGGLGSGLGSGRAGMGGGGGGAGGSSGVGGRSPYARPVNVKAKHYDKARTGGRNMAGVLLRYMEKDGRLFGREDGVEIDREEKIRQWENDRIVWHMMVSPNDGHALSFEEMEKMARDTVSRWEDRLGPLDWVAVVEEKPDAAHPEGNKHLHIAIRGVQEERDLWIDRTMFTEGTLRGDAMEAATDRLGYMSERELVAHQRQLEEGRMARGEGRDMEQDRSRIERAMDEEMERFTLDRNDEFWERS